MSERADRFNERVAERLASMGCFRVWIGSESGSQRILDRMERGVTVDEEFVNVGGGLLEAEYVFPLPAGAMDTGVTLFEGERALEGRLLQADEARRDRKSTRLNSSHRT